MALRSTGHELRHEPDDGGPKTHSINLTKLAEDPDYPINYHHADGGIRPVNTQAQMEGYHHFASMARGMDVHFEVIDVEECARRHPLISTENLVGGLDPWTAISTCSAALWRWPAGRAKPVPRFTATPL